MPTSSKGGMSSEERFGTDDMGTVAPHVMEAPAQERYSLLLIEWDGDTDAQRIADITRAVGARMTKRVDEVNHVWHQMPELGPTDNEEADARA